MAHQSFRHSKLLYKSIMKQFMVHYVASPDGKVTVKPLFIDSVTIIFSFQDFERQTAFQIPDAQKQRILSAQSTRSSYDEIFLNYMATAYMNPLN